MTRPKQVPPVNPLLIVLIGALAAAALPVLGAVAIALVLSMGLIAYGVYVFRGGQRVSGVLLLTAALVIIIAVLLRDYPARGL